MFWKNLIIISFFNSIQRKKKGRKPLVNLEQCVLRFRLMIPLVVEEAANGKDQVYKLRIDKSQGAVNCSQLTGLTH